MIWYWKLKGVLKEEKDHTGGIGSSRHLLASGLIGFNEVCLEAVGL